MKKVYSFLFIIGSSIIANSQNISGKDIFTECISGNTTILVGQTVNFSSVSVAQCSSCYDWDINGNPNSSDNTIVGNLQIEGSDMNQTVSIKGLTAGDATLQLTYFNETGCHNCNITLHVVNPVPVPPLPRIACFGFDPVPNQTNGELNMGFVNSINSPLPEVAGITYTWYFYFKSDGIQVFDGQNPTFLVNCTSDPETSNHIMSFGLIVSNGVDYHRYYDGPSNGTYNIPGFAAETPTCFSHGQCISDGVSGIEYKGKASQNDTEKIKVSPNPTNSILKFEGQGLSKSTVSIFDLQGNEVIKKSDITKEINVEKLRKGVYIYKILNANQVIQEGKVIKN